MLRSLFIALSTSLAIATANAAPNVVVSIKPLHSLTTGVMKGVGEPELILDGLTSPHDFNLKPSQAKSIQNSDLVIWIGEGLEGFLVKSLENLEGKTDTLEIMDIKSISLLDYREHDDHEGHKDHDEHAGHDHDEDKEHKHEEHAEDKDHKHDHDEHKHEEHAEDKSHSDHDDHDHEEHAEHKDEHGHAHGDGKDPHVWLDIDNAKTITMAIATTLSKNDPENAETYTANAKSMIKKLASLDADLEKSLADNLSQKYIVFHDAYQYFEKHFGLKEAISVTLNPEVQPSAARIKELQHEVEENKITCLFSEPQFSPKVLKVVSENTTATIATLDPLGSQIDKGEDQYFQMMSSLANSFDDCVK
jgi:zinc transport system substrate-binding protein